MAKTNEQFDQLFKEKLENHTEKPSSLAWDRLENQLPQQNLDRKIGIWWAVAASITVLLAAAFLFNQNENTPEGEFLAEGVEELVSTPSTISESTASNPAQESTAQIIPQESLTTTPSNLPSNSEKVGSKAPSKSVQQPETLNKSSEMIAVAETKIEIPSTGILEPQVAIEIPVIELPQPKTLEPQNTVAEAKEEYSGYRIKVFSDGLKKGEEPSKNLITEMGKTVGKVEGLLGKVDDGLIELQDKKNSLFASLTAKREADE